MDLESVCDRYLQTLWTLALASPLEYLQGHPFDLAGDDDFFFFELQNQTRGQAARLRPRKGESLRKLLDLREPSLRRGDRFEVFMDGIQLFRPIMIRSPLKTKNAVTTPLLCIGRCREEFAGKPVALSGGPLQFEAYVLWTPKVLPTQHQGVMIRVGNAAGAPFYWTFWATKCPSKHACGRSRPRSSFGKGWTVPSTSTVNPSITRHPHYQFIVKWLHRRCGS